MKKITGEKELNNSAAKVSLHRFLRQSSEQLSQAGFDLPMNEVRYITSRILKLDSALLIAKSDLTITEQQISELSDAIRRRAQHEPAAYIVGEHGFYGRDYFVGKGVLIPRPDTEVLIEKLLEMVHSRFGKLLLLDSFTGSGCIGITLALELLEAGMEVELDLADISEDAVSYATENVRRHNLKHISSVHMTDIWPDAKKQWDIITANPPYIASRTVGLLQPEVSEFEPHIALDGGNDGLDFYRRIFKEAKALLKNEGLLALEHGYDQAEQIKSLAAENNWVIISQYKDFGGQTRVTICGKDC